MFISYEEHKKHEKTYVHFQSLTLFFSGGVYFNPFTLETVFWEVSNTLCPLFLYSFFIRNPLILQIIFTFLSNNILQLCDLLLHFLLQFLILLFYPQISYFMIFKYFCSSYFTPIKFWLPFPINSNFIGYHFINFSFSFTYKLYYSVLSTMLILFAILLSLLDLSQTIIYYWFEIINAPKFSQTFYATQAWAFQLRLFFYFSQVSFFFSITALFRSSLFAYRCNHIPYYSFNHYNLHN